jgi:hypothetical protein
MIDISSKKILATMDLGRGIPVEFKMRLSPDGRTLAIANTNLGQLNIIDLTVGFYVAASLTGFQNISDIAIDFTSRDLFVAEQLNNRLLIVDLLTRRLKGNSITLSGSPTVLAMSPASPIGFAQIPKTLQPIDTSTEKASTPISNADISVATLVGFDPDGANLYMTNPAGNLLQLDPASGKLIRNISAPLAANPPIFPRNSQPERGMWYEPARAGEGYAIEFNSLTRNLFFAGFTYDAAGKPAWFISTLKPSQTGSGYGGRLLSVTQQPNAAELDLGAISVVFSSSRRGTIQMPSGFGRRVIEIQRFPLSDGVVQFAQEGTQLQSGWYIAQSHPGTGYMVDVQSSMLFLAQFAYLPSGLPTWAVAVGPITNGHVVETRLQSFTAVARADGSLSTTISADGPFGITFNGPTAASLRFNDGTILPITRWREY